MDYFNFHTHTSRCGHAFGQDKEYVTNAIKEGFSLLYFSDHVMFPFFSQPRIRGTYNPDYFDYLKSINSLKEKYKDKIAIEIGFEAEYYPGYENYYVDLLKSKEIHYLILGQHYHVESLCDMVVYDRYPNGKNMYVDDVVEGIKSGLFLYVCHPDQLVYYDDERDDEFKELARQIAKASVKYDVPLELNVSKVENGRLQGKENYEQIAAFPDDTFWKVAAEEGVKVIIGLDAHKPENVNQIGFEYGLQLAKKYGLQVLNKADILERIDKIQKKFVK